MSSKKELMRQIETYRFEKRYWKEIAENYQNLYESGCNINSSLKQEINRLEKQLNDDKKYKDLIEYIEQQDLKITSLTKQRDNWKADCEYNEQCFQAEREAKYRLEDEIKVLKGQKTYPCISMNCNDITGESFSLYFYFSYDDRVLLANNVPKYICKDKFIIGTSLNFKGELIYHIGYVEPIIDSLHTMWRLEVDINSSSRNKCKSTIPLNWMNYKSGRKYNLSDYELKYYNIDNNKHKIFYLRDKHIGRTVSFTNLVKTNSKLSEYQLIDTFMEDLDILQIQHFDGQDFNNIYIDLLTFTPHQNMISILDKREDK